MSSNYWHSPRRRLPRRAFLGGASTAIGGLFVAAAAGCGDDNDQPASTTAPAPATAGGAPTSTRVAGSPIASPSVQPKRGGAFIYPIGGEPPSLDVHRSQTSYLSGNGVGAVYSGLIKAQSTGHKGALIAAGDLSEKWEQPDNTTYTFKLRQNAKFHNVAPVNGRVATAEDVVYSFKRQIAEKVNASFLAGLQDIVAIDATTVRITTSSPNVDFLAGIIDPHNKVLAKEAVDVNGNLENGPSIGTGPWIYKEWRKGIGQFMVRNPDYFIAGLPYADRVDMPYFPDNAQVEAQFTQEKLTVCGTGALGGTNVPLKNLQKFDTKKFGQYKIPATAGNMLVMLNQELTQLKDQRIRRALALAMDWDLINNNAQEGIAERDSTSMQLPGPDWRLPQEELAKLFPLDPKAAKMMLEQAGGLPKQFLHTFDAPYTTAAGQLLQAAWKEIGFETEIKIVTPLELNLVVFTPASPPKYTLAVSAILHGPTLTADFETWFASTGPRNSQRINDPQLDSMIKAQRSEFDEKKRRELVFQLQRYVIDKAYVIPLGVKPAIIAYNLHAHNVEPPPFSHQWYAEVWFDDV